MRFGTRLVGIPGGLRHRDDHEPGRGVRRGVPAPGPVVGVWRAQPTGHPDQPSLQRAVRTGSAAPVCPSRSVARATRPQPVAGLGPGVIIGAVLRVYVADDAVVFKLVAASVLFPTGLFILLSSRRAGARLVRVPLHPRTIGLAAFVVGIVGGIYGIGGGSILGPLLVGSGMAVSVVAPAALASTFVTSVVGVATFAVLQVNVSGSIAPDWSLGVACGLGGLCGATSGRRCNPAYPSNSCARCSASWPSASPWSTRCRPRPERARVPLARPRTQPRRPAPGGGG